MEDNRSFLKIVTSSKDSFDTLIEKHKYDSLIKKSCFESVSKRKNELFQDTLTNCFNMTKEAMLIKELIERRINM